MPQAKMMGVLVVVGVVVALPLLPLLVQLAAAQGGPEEVRAQRPS